MNVIEQESPMHKNNTVVVGVLLSSTDDKYENALLRGIADSITGTGANLICFTSGAIRSYHGFEFQRNLLYDLVNKEIFQGLVISATLGHNISHEELKGFCEQYYPIQLVTIAVELDGIPTVQNGSFQGISDVVTHLIEEHSYKKIAFIRGPEDHQEANERYQAYCDTLHAHGIPLHDELVLQGDYTFESGRKAALDLLKLNQTIQAVVSANDSMALGVLEILKENEKRVPTDIALTGFDDTEDSRQSDPPLTTLKQSVYDIGQQAGIILLGTIEENPITAPVVIPPRLIIRNSCGCADQRLKKSGFLPDIEPKEKWNSETRLASIRKMMQKVIFAPTDDLVTAWINRLIQAFEKELESGSSSAFLNELEDVLNRSLTITDDGSQWQDAISIMRSEILNNLNDLVIVQRAETLWQQARVLVSTQILKSEERKRLYIEHRNVVLRELSEALMASTSREDVLDVIALDLPRLGIKACYLSLFEDVHQSIDWSYLVFAYNSQGILDLPPGGIRFPSQQLTPDNFLSTNQASTWVAEALYAKEERLGFVLLNVDPKDADVCGALRGLISNALQAVILNERRMDAEAQLREHQRNLEQLVEARTLALRETNEQLQQEITERQRTEVERESLIKELESKNAELERFTYTVSHDLKSPLVTISGFLGYIEEDAASGNTERLQKDIQSIQKATSKMQSLLNELLELSRIGRMVNDPQPIPFNDLVNAALESVHGILDANNVTVHTQPNLPTIYGDRQRLMEVLQNLIDNAAKYTKEKNSPTIEIGQAGEEGNKPIFYVKDNGIGIAPKYHELIFGLFEKLDANTEGTGVVLALVKRIIEFHGGRIWVESEAGQGTTFYFTLKRGE